VPYLNYSILLKNPGVGQNSAQSGSTETTPGGPIVQCRPNNETDFFGFRSQKGFFSRINSLDTALALSALQLVCQRRSHLHPCFDSPEIG